MACSTVGPFARAILQSTGPDLCFLAPQHDPPAFISLSVNLPQACRL